MKNLLPLVFFFFQAEDGIRDIGVTGVQTCALPMAFADVEQHGLDSLALDGLAVGHGHSQGALVEGDRPVEVLGGHADVIDSTEHAAWSLRSGQRIARRTLPLRLLLHPQDLAQRRNSDLELLGRRLLRCDPPLYLVARSVESAGG